MASLIAAGSRPCLKYLVDDQIQLLAERLLTVHQGYLRGRAEIGEWVIETCVDTAAADLLVRIDAPEVVVDQAGVVVVGQLPGAEQGGGLQVAQLAAEGLAEALHTAAGAGKGGAVAVQAGLPVVAVPVPSASPPPLPRA